MRTFVCFILFLWPCATGLPQGQFVFNNRVSSVVVAPIFGVESGDPTLIKRGNTASGTPTGTQTYSGSPLSGAGYTAQFFGGAGDALVEELQPILPRVTFQTGALSGFVVPPPNAVVVSNVLEGENARLQLRCWDNRSGTITNWSQVIADPAIPHGESLPFLSPPLGGSFSLPPNPIGLQSLNLATGSPVARLTVELTATNTTVISWPSLLTDFVLQENTDGFAPQNWSNTTAQPTDNGTIRYLLVNPTDGDRFYRLVKP